MRFTIATLALIASLAAAAAQDRFPIIQPDQMNAEQKKLFETIVSGPRAANYGGDAVNRVLRGGPFNAWMRSPRGRHAIAGGRRADPLQELDPETPERVRDPDHGARMDLAIRMVCASFAGDESGP
jgi:hypothetical protein